MKEIMVDVHPDGKKVKAFVYAPAVLLVYAKSVWNTDSSIITDPEGFRYRRRVAAEETAHTLFFSYEKI